MRSKKPESGYSNLARKMDLQFILHPEKGDRPVVLLGGFREGLAVEIVIEGPF